MKVRSRRPVAGVKAGGFTLIELLIVVAIVAILASVSMGGYRQYVRRANRVDATSALLRISAAQERFYLQNNSYATTAEELTAPPSAGLGISGTQHGLYDLAVIAGPDGATTGYTATATAASDASQRDDEGCRIFSIDQSGQRSAANAGGTESAEITARCWR
ncbi:MAG: prepilin-type N-terminal cleavage/methylation domain-containing protein [Chromatiales bacterium]|nr:MAG: prepilin-type N-terminal cleavage/methylation domain-containing protein [Chromatiales bacterium]